ncbi:hypothetical protein N9L83_02560, partial [Flavobacteriales bacterium]|nr:hypothetical protein [Flavobacteriales bacterium]
IAVTHDGASRKHYLDGVEVGSWAEPSSFEFGSHTVGIGWCASGFDCTFNGKMDELSVWHKALSPGEIGAFMSCPYEANQDSLVAFWDFEFDNGGYTADKTGNGHTLSIINNPGISFEERSNSCQPFCVSATYDFTMTFEGCTDDYACNYSSEATINDGSCDYSCCPGPGCCGAGTLWDSTLGHCVTVSALCAASCGEGTVWDPISEECIIAIPADLNFDGCVTVNDLLLLLAVHSTCPPLPEWPDEPTDTTWACGDPLTYWDYDYATVLIGDQCWFAENLRNTQYQTGDNIVLWDYEGEVDTYGLGHYTYKDLNTANADTFGLLYTWHAATHELQLCPTGWHTPSQQEFQNLMNATDVISGDLSSTAQVTALQSFSIWTLGTGSNATGFSALPGSQRTPWGGLGYGDQYEEAFWWTSDQDGGNFVNLSLAEPLNGEEKQIGFGTCDNPNDGMSVRCLKD